MCYAVTAEEIERLSKRFKKLDLDNSGSISITEFKTVLPELADNPLVSRVIAIFDADGNGELDFQGSLFLSYTTADVVLEIAGSADNPTFVSRVNRHL